MHQDILNESKLTTDYVIKEKKTSSNPGYLISDEKGRILPETLSSHNDIIMCKHDPERERSPKKKHSFTAY